jgi:thiamine pyrophosphokinase
MEKTCVLVLGGQIRDRQAFIKAVMEADYVLAADSGAHHLASTGRIPDVIMGDLDSIDPVQLTFMEAAGCRIHRYPVEKDDTDSCLSLKEAAAMGFESIEIWGALGSRIDHTFANLMLLQLPEIRKGQHVVIRDGGLSVFLPEPGETITGRPGDYVSLFALGSPVCGFRNRGLKYQPPGDRYDMNYPLGISNELTGTEAWINWDQGVLLCMLLDRETYGGSDHDGNK